MGKCHMAKTQLPDNVNIRDLREAAFVGEHSISHAFNSGAVEHRNAGRHHVQAMSFGESQI